MPPRLHELHVENFRSLRDVTLKLGGLNVLVGPNGAGKTNVLKSLVFLAEIVENDLPKTESFETSWGQWLFWAKEHPPEHLEIGVDVKRPVRSGETDRDYYSLRVEGLGTSWRRSERLVYDYPDVLHVALDDNKLVASWPPDSRIDSVTAIEHEIRVDPHTSGLSVLPRLSPDYGSTQTAALATMLREIRYISHDTKYLENFGGASRYSPGKQVKFSDSGENLAAFLLMLRDSHPESFSDLVADAVSVLPQLEAIDFEFPSGGAREVIIVLHERGLSRPTEFNDASFGTMRLLHLLAALYDPEPPAITCIEEVELGLHPQALELLVDRLRGATERTQFLIATHSPTFVDRLRPEEIIICERRDDGSSAIPTLSTDEIRDIVVASEDEPLGRLWFSGALGGDL